MQTRPLAAIVALSTLALTTEAAAVPVTVQLTADNAYAIYTGNGTAVTDHWATEFNVMAGDIATPETYSFTMNDGDVIYVAAWSDDATHQGLLAEFDIGGTVVTTSSTHWEVMATGIDLDVGDAAPTIDELTTQVLLGDAGGGASGGWVTPELGDFNDGSAIVNVSAMASYVQWAWYRSAGTASSDTAFFPGANHDEYLIFRMKFPMEGCCLGDECFNTDPDDCSALGGTPLGDELLCEDFAGECQDPIDPVGACCTKEECIDLPREECLDAEGTYLGDEVSCEDVDADCVVDEPETGACCVDGECAEMEHDKCLEMDGDFAGIGVSCEDIAGECDDPTTEEGACCIDDTCEVTHRIDCEDGGGVFWGVGTDCDSAEVECPTDDGTTDPVDTDGPVDPAEEVAQESKPAPGCSATGRPLRPLGPLGLLLTLGLVARRRTQA